MNKEIELIINKELARTNKENKCLIWTGGVSRKGFPQISVNLNNKRSTLLLHRFFYKHLINKGNEIEKDKVVSYTCKNKLCLNIEHMYLELFKIHMMGTDCFWAKQSRKTHCKRGHEYNEYNLIINKKGQRSCKICKTISLKKINLTESNNVCENNHELTLENIYGSGKKIVCKICENHNVNRILTEYPYKYSKCEFGDVEKTNRINYIFSRVRIKDSGCWEWVGNVGNGGYGVLSINGKNYRSHRILYNLYKGTIKERLVLDHICRNRICCNPIHLRELTRGENVLIGHTLAAKNLSKTHCPKGHEYNGSNLGTSKKGNRFCVQCRKERDRKYWASGKKKKYTSMKCPYGHFYVEGNYILDVLGRRRCLLCRV